MMKFVFLILTVYGLACEAQETEMEENEDFSCSAHCRSTRHCPSIFSILYTVRGLPSDCRQCIFNECGSKVSRENVTEVAECMFWARSGCEECELSSSSLIFRQNCQNCTQECEDQLESGITPTMPLRVARPTFFRATPKPRRVRRPTFRRRFRHSRRFPKGRRFVITTVCRCESPAMCPDAGETNEKMTNESVSCRDCIEEACAEEAQGDRAGLPQCIMEARAECTGCSQMTTTERVRMQNCKRCVRRCRFVTSRRSNETSSSDCDRPCTRPGVCPRTEAVIATIGRTPEACQECITEQCGVVSDRDRDGTASCMFQARATCDSCRLGPFEREQRNRCSRCREECENDETDTGVELTPDGSGEAQESTP